MAAFHGKRGAASFTNLTFEMISWSADGTADTAEATVMDSSAVSASTHWKAHLIGFKDWTATAECLEPAAGAGIAALGTSATLTLDSTDGLAYSGTALCIGFAPAVDSKDVGKCTLRFQGNGQLSAA
jgi:hypothetical protein